MGVKRQLKPQHTFALHLNFQIFYYQNDHLTYMIQCNTYPNSDNIIHELRIINFNVCVKT